MSLLAGNQVRLAPWCQVVEILYILAAIDISTVWLFGGRRSVAISAINIDSTEKRFVLYLRLGVYDQAPEQKYSGAFPFVLYLSPYCGILHK